MSNDNMNGHHSVQVPKGDPQVMRVLQHALQLAQQGILCGVTIVGVTPDGQAHQSVALPQNAAALLLTIGATESLKMNLLDNIRQLQNPANVSKILRPGMSVQG